MIYREIVCTVSVVGHRRTECADFLNDTADDTDSYHSASVG